MLARSEETRTDKGMIRLFLLSPFVLFCGSCVSERTVTDGSGRVLYQDTEAHSPFESEKQKQREVDQKERQLGLDGTAI